MVRPLPCCAVGLLMDICGVLPASCKLWASAVFSLCHERSCIPKVLTIELERSCQVWPFFAEGMLVNQVYVPGCRCYRGPQR